MRKRIMRYLSLLTILFSSTIYASGSCQVETLNGLNFGIYNPATNSPDDSVGTITLSCTRTDNAISYQITFNSGISRNYLQRVLTDGQYKLNYNLFTNASRTIILGDGTSGTGAMVGSVTNNFSHPISLYVYGRIFPHQFQIAQGDYVDNIVLSVNY